MLRPLVAINLASSLNGKLAAAVNEGVNFSSPLDRRFLRHLRSMADVVLVGSQTIRVDNMGLGVLDPALQAKRLARGKSPQPLGVVLGGRHGVPASSRIFQDSRHGPLLWVAGPHTPPPPACAWLHIWRYAQHPVDIRLVLQRLASGGTELVVCEGGPCVQRQLLQHGCVDFLFMTLCPLLLGGTSSLGWPKLFEHEALPPCSIELQFCQAFGNEVFCCYRLNHKTVI